MGDVEAISYSDKTQAIMKMFGMEKCVLDFRNMTLDGLLHKTNDAWEKREEIADALGPRVPVAQEHALLSGRLVSELLALLGHDGCHGRRQEQCGNELRRKRQ